MGKKKKKLVLRMQAWHAFLLYFALSSIDASRTLCVFGAQCKKRRNSRGDRGERSRGGKRNSQRKRERESRWHASKTKKVGSKPESDASALPLLRPLPPAQSLLEPAWIVDHSRLLLTIRVWSCLVRGSSLEKRSGAGEMKR